MSIRQLLLIVTALLAGLLSGCAANDACYERSTSPESLRSVYVVKRAWHTGVAVAAADWPDRDWSVLGDFPESRYLEFGWGDARRAAARGARTEQVLLRQATLFLSTDVQLVDGPAIARWRLSHRRVVRRHCEQSRAGSEGIRERALSTPAI